MPSHRDRTALADALGGIAVDSVQRLREVDRRQAAIAPGLTVQGFQLDLSGRAALRPVWDDQRVKWRDPFLNDVAKDVGGLAQLDDPLFSAGVEVRSGDYVDVIVQLREWIRDSRSLVTGAVIRLGAAAPYAPMPVRFSARAHLTFMGHAAPDDDEDA